MPNTTPSGRTHRPSGSRRWQQQGNTGAAAKDAESASDGNGQRWPDDLRLAMPGESFASSVQELVNALLWIEYASHVKEVRDDAAAAQ